MIKIDKLIMLVGVVITLALFANAVYVMYDYVKNVRKDNQNVTRKA